MWAVNCHLIQFLPASIFSLLPIFLLLQRGGHGGLSLDEERTAMDEEEEEEWTMKKKNEEKRSGAEWGCVKMRDMKECFLLMIPVEKSHKGLHTCIIFISHV